MAFATRRGAKKGRGGGATELSLDVFCPDLASPYRCLRLFSATSVLSELLAGPEAASGLAMRKGMDMHGEKAGRKYIYMYIYESSTASAVVA